MQSMKVEVTIYKEVYDFKAGFMTMRKVESIIGTKEQIRERFNELMNTYPTQKFHYIVE